MFNIYGEYSFIKTKLLSAYLLFPENDCHNTPQTQMHSRAMEEHIIEDYSCVLAWGVQVDYWGVRAK